VLLLPVVFEESEPLPFAVLPEPVVFALSVLIPFAVLLAPVVLFIRAELPIAVFVEMPPFPLPIVIHLLLNHKPLN